MTADDGRWASAAQMAWTLAGCPRRDSLPASPLPGRCAMCGAMARETVPARATVANGTFADRNLLAAPHADVTCYGCAWVMSGRPPRAVRTWTVACAPGRDLGPSHPKSQPAAEGGHPGLLLTARNDMRAVARLLADPPDGPWCAAVAESGQKHALPWACVNHGARRWHVRMDALDVRADPAEFRDVLGRVAALRAAGFPSAAIEQLDPGGRLAAANIGAWREHSAALMPWRASPLLHLACFIPNKEHLDEYRGYLAA